MSVMIFVVDVIVVVRLVMIVNEVVSMIFLTVTVIDVFENGEKLMGFFFY